jgi:RimJ/RimL family protein N-acetyltransferase
MHSFSRFSAGLVIFSLFTIDRPLKAKNQADFWEKSNNHTVSSLQNLTLRTIIPLEEQCIKPLTTVHYLKDDKGELNISIFKTDFMVQTYKEEDIVFLKSIHQNPSITKTLIYSGIPYSEDQINRSVQCWQRLKRSGPYAPYVVRKGKDFIGYFKLFSQEKDLEVAYVVLPEFQGKGWGNKIMEVITVDLVPFLKSEGYLDQFDTLVAHILGSNKVSKRIVKKFGFKKALVHPDKKIPATWQRFERNL